MSVSFVSVCRFFLCFSLIKESIIVYISAQWLLSFSAGWWCWSMYQLDYDHKQSHLSNFNDCQIHWKQPKQVRVTVITPCSTWYAIGSSETELRKTLTTWSRVYKNIHYFHVKYVYDCIIGLHRIRHANRGCHAFVIDQPGRRQILIQLCDVILSPSDPLAGILPSAGKIGGINGRCFSLIFLNCTR